MRAEIDVNPTMLTWAITRAGHSLDEFLDQNPVVQRWLDGVKKPTVKQLEDFSKRVHIPFGYLFLNEPPQEAVPFPFFRTGKKKPTGKVSLNVYDTIIIMQRRQEWLTSYLLDNDARPLKFVASFDVNAKVHSLVNDIRNTLNVQPDWAKNFKSFEDSLNFLVGKIEEAGIIVNFNGVVENNTKRVIPVQECRGFVLVNRVVPFMFINAADAKAAQLFTIVHELAHIWLGESAGFNNDSLLPADDPIELLCDHVAAEFLVPENNFLALWKNAPNLAAVARFFKVSQIVIARRALDLGLMSKKDFLSFYHIYILGVKAKKEQATGGGDFYLTARKRVSVSFANYVHNAVKQERLLYRDAYKITGLKGDTYQNFVSKYLY